MKNLFLLAGIIFITASSTLNSMSPVFKRTILQRFSHAFSVKNHTLASKLVADFKKETHGSCLFDDEEATTNHFLKPLQNQIDKENKKIARLENAWCKNTFPLTLLAIPTLYFLEPGSALSLTASILSLTSIWGAIQDIRLRGHSAELKEKIHLFNQIAQDVEDIKKQKTTEENNI